MLLKNFRLLAMLVMILLLNGCGNKGALHLPEETAETFFLKETADIQ